MHLQPVQYCQHFTNHTGAFSVNHQVITLNDTSVPCETENQNASNEEFVE